MRWWRGCSRSNMRAAPSASMRLSGGTAPLFAVAVDDAAARQVVGRELDADAIAGRDSNEVAAHAAGRVGDELVAVFELDLEHRVRQSLRDRGVHDDGLLFLVTIVSLGAPSLRRTCAATRSSLLAQIPFECN